MYTWILHHHIVVDWFKPYHALATFYLNGSLSLLYLGARPFIPTLLCS